MTDIVSSPPAPSSPAESKVETGAFWPDIDVNEVRARMNLFGEIPHARLVEAIEWGVITTTEELTSWGARQMADGFGALTEIDPANQVNGKTAKELLFLAAVSSHAAARLAKRNPDLTATREGSDRGDQRRATADDFLADATRAIRSIQGETGTVSELI